MSNTTVILLGVLFFSEQIIAFVLRFQTFFMKMALSGITIAKEALYVPLHNKIKSSVFAKPLSRIILFFAKKMMEIELPHHKRNKRNLAN